MFRVELSVIVIYELERMCEELVVICFKILVECARGNRKNIVLKKRGVQTEC